MTTALGDVEDLVFQETRDRLEAAITFLKGSKAAALTAAELEWALQDEGRELVRCLLQGQLVLRSRAEERLAEVSDADGVSRSRAEGGHVRTLATIFGEVEVSRIAYRGPGLPNLHPADAALNLPEERHSHGLRRLAAIEASRGSFDDAVEAIERATGQRVGKRQVEGLVQAAATDVEAFYASRRPDAGDPGDLVVLSADGKGIVMRPSALRPPTATAAAAAKNKLSTRLSRGEKANRKRMAELGVVYDAKPVVRTPADILVDKTQPHSVTPGPVAKSKWLTASVVENAATVLSEVFDEAERRDPTHERTWVALVDGNRHQISVLGAQAKKRGVKLNIVVDFIHVLEYLWKAVWCFYNEADPAAEVWVRKMALGVLGGRATTVAGIIRRAATRAGLEPDKRKGADACATYLSNLAPHLDYPKALNEGWPIATGVIEGACRHLVKDRMALTGARWGLEGAEAVLKLRTLRSNGDFDEYFKFHLSQERKRIHESRFADSVIPRAA
jgi:hypothetical protein